MSSVIELSDEVVQFIKQHAEHLTLCMKTKEVTVDGKDDTTSQEDYIPYILRVIRSMPNCQGEVDAVCNCVFEIAPLKPADLEVRADGHTPIWRNNIQWARMAMVQAGLIHSPEVSGRGIWRLTEAGIAEANKIIG